MIAILDMFHFVSEDVIHKKQCVGGLVRRFIKPIS